MKHKLYKLSILLFATLSLDAKEILLHKDSYINHEKIKTLYLIKIGTFKSIEYAQNLLKNSTSFIIRENGYYNVIASSYDDRKEALQSLKQLRQTYSDAYIVKGYEKIGSERVAEVKRVQRDFLEEADRAFREGEFESALALYDKEMINHPNSKRAALGYATTLYKLGFYKESKKEFQKILVLNPPANVKRNIEAFLDSIDSKLTVSHFYGSVTIAMGYDDNLGYNSSKRYTEYGGIKFENDTNKTKGSLGTLSLLLGHHYSKEAFSWDNSFYTYNEMQSKDTIEDLNYFNFTTAPSYGYGSYRFTLPMGVDYSFLDRESESNTIFSSPEIKYRFDRDMILSLVLNISKTKNKRDEGRSYKSKGFKTTLLKRHDALTIYGAVGYRDDKKSSGERYDVSKKLFDGYINILYKLNTLFMVTNSYYYELSKYNDLDEALGYKREDDKYRATFGFDYLVDRADIFSCSYQYLKNSSNINAYSYDKNSLFIKYTKKF